MMRIGLLSAWASRSGGGVFEAVVSQARLIEAIGHVPLVFALEDEFSSRDRARFGDAAVQTLPVRGPARFGYAPGLIGALQSADLDLLHLHGIWMYPSLAGARWAEATQRPYIISPHGMLDPWITGRGRVKKAVARQAYESRSWAAATCFHALTDTERADIERETGRAAVVVAPNAVEAQPAPAPQMQGRPYLLSLGRIHPKKNIHGLIEGWRGSAAGRLGWDLVIAGWGDPQHVRALEQQLAEHDDTSIHFVGSVFGEQKAELIARSTAIILPSFSEGLPMVILEAWAAGRPVIMSPACNLPEGFVSGAAMETGVAPVAISAAINQALALPPEALQQMSDAARTLVASRFSNTVVADQWRHIYDLQP